MSGEWEKVEITAITRQTKSAAQVEAEYKARQWAQLSKEADEALARSKVRTAALEKTDIATPALKRFMGWDTTVAAGANIDTGTRSVLDNAAKSTSPIINSAEANLRALAGGGFVTNFANLKVGNSPISIDSAKALAAKLPTNLATTTAALKNGAMGSMPGLVIGSISDLSSKAKNLFGGGIGQTGSFNPAGVALATETNPSGGSYIKLAKSVFTSGTTVQGETVDIYDKTLNSPQNSVKSILSDVLSIANKSVLGSIKNTLLKAASGSGALSSSLASVNLSTAKGLLNKYKGTLLSGVPLSEDGMLKELYSAVGYDGKSLAFKGGLKGVGESMLKEITGNIDGQTGIVSLYKDVKTVLKGDSDTAASLFKIVDNFTGNARLGSFLNLNEELKIISNVSKALVAMGAIDQLEKVIEKVDHKDRDKYIGDTLQSGLDSGDVNFLKFALKHTSGAKILASYPDAISRIVSSFRPEVDNDNNITVANYTDLVSCLYQISPEWDVAGYHNGMKVFDYGIFSKFNQQGKLAILASNNRFHISALISAENYANSFDTGIQLQMRYPDYPII